jgi:hypothetical protein
MIDLIERLQKRSPESRHRVSFWAATLVTLLIAIMWGTSLFIGGVSHPAKTATVAGTPASSLWREMGRGARSLIDSLKK